MKWGSQGSPNVARAGFGARLHTRYDNARDATNQTMAELAQNPWVRAGVEVISHSAFYDPISIGAEYAMAVYSAYQESHHDTDYTVDTHDNTSIDHRNDTGMEHKARDSLEDDDHQAQSATDMQDTITVSLDDMNPDQGERMLRSDEGTATTDTGRGTEYQSSDSPDKAGAIATEQDRDTHASPTSQGNNIVADEVQANDGALVNDEATDHSTKAAVNTEDPDKLGDHTIVQNTDEDTDDEDTDDEDDEDFDTL